MTISRYGNLAMVLSVGALGVESGRTPMIIRSVLRRDVAANDF
ncbi:MAG: hypothetical protein ACP5O0_06070 [Acidimicrobiales bacterium]